MKLRQRIFVSLTIAAIISFQVYCYNNKPIFTMFREHPFVYIPYQLPTQKDYCGNYMCYDYDHNIILVVMTGYDPTVYGLIDNGSPRMVSKFKCNFFTDTEYESTIDLNDDYLIFFNANTKYEFRMPLEKEFVKRNIPSYFGRVHDKPSGEKLDIADEMVKMFPDIARNVEALRVPE